MTSSSSPPSNDKLNQYYLIFGFTLIFIVLLIISAVAMNCCTWFQRQFILMRRLLIRKHNGLEMQRWIPTFKYHKKEEEEEEAAPECVICLYTFDEEEEVRQLPSCRHLFHAACIDLWLNTHNNCPICRGIIVLHSMNMST
ncbi:RING-H2 finger protein ATL80 [Dendrobium catenatum]|uniref:RING-type E3 ubiquitin transferase n=1 Tax=Dendrobium catenatum TaxID=906689 RepID=A0A2I0XCQ5_9ASPA|nr:RING-H2 finger protein ATL80 [Dendrobium catenatum]